MPDARLPLSLLLAFAASATACAQDAGTREPVGQMSGRSRGAATSSALANGPQSVPEFQAPPFRESSPYEARPRDVAGRGGQPLRPTAGTTARPTERATTRGSVRPAGYVEPAAGERAGVTGYDSAGAAPAPRMNESDASAAASFSRTPINRGPASATTPDGRPSASATLKKGLWSSGTAVVLLAVFGCVAVMLLKRKNPALAGGLPAEAVDLLGRKRIDARHSVGLVRVGNTILVVGIGEGGLRTLSTIEDPAEVDRLAGACRPGHSAGGFPAMLRDAMPSRRTTSPTPTAAANPAAPLNVATQPAATQTASAQTAGPHTATAPPRAAAASPTMADLPGRRSDRGQPAARPAPTRLDLSTP